MVSHIETIKSPNRDVDPPETYTDGDFNSYGGINTYYVYMLILDKIGIEFANAIYEKNPKIFEKLTNLRFILKYAGKKPLPGIIDYINYLALLTEPQESGAAVITEPQLPAGYVLATDNNIVRIVRYDREENGIYYNDEMNICVANGQVFKSDVFSQKKPGILLPPTTLEDALNRLFWCRLIEDGFVSGYIPSGTER